MKVIVREFYFSEKLKLFSKSLRSSYVNNIEYSFIATPNSNTIKKYRSLYDDLKLVYVSNVDEYELTFRYQIKEVRTYSKFPKREVVKEDLYRKEAIKILISENKKLTEFKIHRKIIHIKRVEDFERLKKIGLEEWKKYSITVRKLTKLNDIKKLENYENRAYIGGYHLDHKISVYYGYRNGITCDKIAHISNLRYITGIENFCKNRKIYVDKDNQWIIDSMKND